MQIWKHLYIELLGCYQGDFVGYNLPILTPVINWHKRIIIDTINVTSF